MPKYGGVCLSKRILKQRQELYSFIIVDVTSRRGECAAVYARAGWPLPTLTSPSTRPVFGCRDLGCRTGRRGGASRTAFRAMVARWRAESSAEKGGSDRTERAEGEVVAGPSGGENTNRRRGDCATEGVDLHRPKTNRNCSVRADRNSIIGWKTADPSP